MGYPVLSKVNKLGGVPAFVSQFDFFFLFEVVSNGDFFLFPFNKWETLENYGFLSGLFRDFCWA